MSEGLSDQIFFIMFHLIFTREDALAGLVIEILHQQKFKVHVKMKIPLDVDIKSHKYQIGFTKAIYLQTNS